MKFCTMISSRPRFIIPVQFLGGRGSQRNLRAKYHAKFGAIFGWLQTLTANNSGTNKQNLANISSIAIPLAFGGRSAVSFIRKCCATKFSHALENNQVLLAHPPPSPRTGVSFATFYNRGQQLAKNSACYGVSHKKFKTRGSNLIKLCHVACR